MGTIGEPREALGLVPAQPPMDRLARHVETVRHLHERFSSTVLWMTPAFSQTPEPDQAIMKVVVLNPSESKFVLRGDENRTASELHRAVFASAAVEGCPR